VRFDRPGDTSARLRSRPGSVEAAGLPTGEAMRLGPESERNGLLFVPRSARLSSPEGVPLIVVLHGAGGSAGKVLQRFLPHAERLGAIVLAPDSRSRSWGALQWAPAPDTEYLDAALGQVFKAYRVDPRRVGVAGFSDGASWALILGLANGDLFSSVAAFSPGYAAVPASPVGRPRIFVSHGTKDEVLPIDRSSRPIVQALGGLGYDVTFRPFDGPHTVPEEILREGIDGLFR